MKLSIVATLYQSSQYVLEFFTRASAVARKLVDDDYEIIFVNDGSTDRSLEVAIAITRSDPHVVVVDLSRNFGHHKAMMTGLKYACGDLVFLIDSDLEEAPEWLLSFADQMIEQRCDVVFGVQATRKGQAFERLSGWLFYSAFRFFTGIAQPNNIATARLMSRRYVDALILHEEREINIGGLWLITGFQQTSIVIHKKSTSPTTYSFSKKVHHLVNSVTSFSSLPLVFTFYSGCLISLSALLYIAYLAFLYFYVSSPPSGYTSTIASIWLFSGFIIFFLGVQGIYISKLFSEVKRRPYTIVREIYGKND